MATEEQQTAQVASAPVNDTEAEAELQRFVEGFRATLPEQPKHPAFSHLSFSPEAEGFAAEREHRYEERAAELLRAELVKRAKELVSDAGDRYRNCTLANFTCDMPQQRKVVAALSEYLEGARRDNVILYGPVGTGKDHLAFAVAKLAVKAGQSVRWINGQKWFGLIRDAMDTDRSESSIVRELTQPDLVCLSDPLPPVGPLTQFQATMLYRLVDARYSRGVPTICTINVADDAEADERMGAATWDRLCHGAWKLHCGWPTYRKPTREL
jgi:DNA replication protein DnaC